LDGYSSDSGAKGIANVLRALRLDLPTITRPVVGIPASLADNTSTIPMSDLSAASMAVD
jgi:hypothetical protein